MNEDKINMLLGGIWKNQDNLADWKSWYVWAWCKRYQANRIYLDEYNTNEKETN